MYNTANQPRKCIRDLWLHILVVWIWFDWRLSGTCRRRIWPINKPAAAMVGAWQRYLQYRADDHTCRIWECCLLHDNIHSILCLQWNMSTRLAVRLWWDIICYTYSGRRMGTDREQGSSNNRS